MIPNRCWCESHVLPITRLEPGSSRSPSVPHSPSRFGSEGVRYSGAGGGGRWKPGQSNTVFTRALGRLIEVAKLNFMNPLSPCCRPGSLFVERSSSAEEVGGERGGGGSHSVVQGDKPCFVCGTVEVEVGG